MASKRSFGKKSNPYKDFYYPEEKNGKKKKLKNKRKKNVHEEFQEIFEPL